MRKLISNKTQNRNFNSSQDHLVRRLENSQLKAELCAEEINAKHRQGEERKEKEQTKAALL